MGVVLAVNDCFCGYVGVVLAVNDCFCGYVGVVLAVNVKAAVESNNKGIVCELNRCPILSV